MNAKTNPHLIFQKVSEKSKGQKFTEKSLVYSLKSGSDSTKNKLSASLLKNDQIPALEEEMQDYTTFQNPFQKLKQQNQQIQQIQLFSNALKKFKDDKIRLEIDSTFECDNSVSSFVGQIQVLCEKVRYFNWIIKGSFTDNGSGRLFGDLIVKMKNLFSLNLHFNSEQIGDKAAAQLGIALQQQKKLHIFNIKFSQMECKMSHEGFERIITSLKTLPNIEIFNYYFNGYRLEDCIGENISDYQFSFVEQVYQKYYLEDHEYIWNDAFQNFCQKADQKANTHINFPSNF